jgi:hypothetical protein
MADAVGGDSDAIEMVATLAGISNYDLVDVNTEVFRNFNRKFARIIEPLERADPSPSIGAAAALIDVLNDQRDPSRSLDGLGNTNNMDSLRRYLMTSGLGESQEEVLPGFPLQINGPNVYYLYVGPTQ